MFACVAVVWCWHKTRVTEEVFRGGGHFGRGEVRGECFAVKKSVEISPSEIFAACDQQLHCKFRCRMCSRGPGGGKVQRCVYLQHAVVV